MSADSPDRPGVAALVAELEVRRHVRTAFVVGVAFALLVFVLFAYLPGTEESLLYWAGLTFVLAFAVFGIVATVLLSYATYRRTLEVNGADPGGRSPTTLAIAFGLVGWLLVPVAATLAFGGVSGGLALALGRTTGEANGLTLLVAVITGGFAVLAVGGLGLRFVTALSLSNEWRPLEAAVGSVAYTALVAAPAVGCPSGGVCLGTPDRLVAATVGFEFAAVTPAYAAVTLGGGLLVGVALGLRNAAPPHGFFAGLVAATSTLPLVAAVAGDASVVVRTALYLPVVLGGVAAVGSGLVVAFGHRPDSTVTDE